MKRQALQRFLFLILCLFCFSAFSFSQDHTISGKVTDAQNRQALAFVNIVVNDGPYGGMSDIDGRYSITAPEAIRSIRFSYIGYETKMIDSLSHSKLNVSLTPISIELQEATVEAGENPAHRIIDSVMAHRKQNNPSSLHSYSYHIYDKMVFTIDSSRFEAAKVTDTIPQSDISMFDSILRKNDLMVMETASEVKFLGPDRRRQNVLGTKISGMRDPTFFYMVNEMQTVSFYEDLVEIMGKDYVNPISRGSKSKYFFNIESATPTHEGDTLFTISFHPYLGTIFDALTGVLNISSDQWAVQSVKAEPTEKKGFFAPSIQQLYQKIDGHWFPKQFNINLVATSAFVVLDGNDFPLVAVGKSYLTDIQINNEISKREFSEMEVVVDKDAAYRDEQFWSQQRIDSLSQRTQATYTFMDSVTEGTDIFDRVLGSTTEMIQDGTLPIGKISIDLGRITRYSQQKGWYLGLGLSTNERFSRTISFNAFGGYWFRLKGWDFGAGSRIKLNPQRQMELGLKANFTSEAAGEFHGMDDDNSLLGESNYKYTFYENIDVRQSLYEVQFASRFARYFKGFVNFDYVKKHYLRQFYCQPDEALTDASYCIAEAKLRFAYKEKFISDTKGIRSLGTSWPIVWLSYAHSFKGIFDCPYEYDRVKFQVSKNIYTKYWGISQILFQTGYASEGAPVMETFSILGAYVPIGIYSPGCFNTMREDEFFCDRFVALYLSHNFSGMIWQPNSWWFHPNLVLVTNLGWGDMPKAHNCPEHNFKTMEKGYFESGICVKGIISTNITEIGAGVFYRYGPYSLPKVWDNFAWKLTASFSL